MVSACPAGWRSTSCLSLCGLLGALLAARRLPRWWMASGHLVVSGLLMPSRSLGASLPALLPSDWLAHSRFSAQYLLASWRHLRLISQRLPGWLTHFYLLVPSLFLIALCDLLISRRPPGWLTLFLSFSALLIPRRSSGYWTHPHRSALSRPLYALPAFQRHPLNALLAARRLHDCSSP